MPKQQTNVAAWVIGMVVVGVIGIVSFIVSLLLVIFGAMRSSEPYKEALKRAKADPRVIAALGSPIQPGLLVNGNLETKNDDGVADLDFTLKGPKGKADVNVAGTKTRGRWYYTRIIVTPPSGPEIDLLSPDEPSPEGSTSTAPPAG